MILAVLIQSINQSINDILRVIKHWQIKDNGKLNQNRWTVPSTWWQFNVGAGLWREGFVEKVGFDWKVRVMNGKSAYVMMGDMRLRGWDEKGVKEND